MWRDSARVPFGGGSGPGEAESEAQDEFVTGFGNPQSGLYHALQAERCHVNSGATEVFLTVLKGVEVSIMKCRSRVLKLFNG
ncbi:hypothetical protein DUI87_07503 [Hirundo rustica rustica]|uniref:Uncharacterized protein n=1 Tax=Hirundo rustica rustica TaxID=333673 RepID=A0A3M0KV69_HIRRU|nr:hypothetical protein DUI87_07503 [Hirundo rustica rustica]